MMENSELTYEEKLVETGKRVQLEISLLKRLPEERLNVYFNRTTESWAGEYPAALGIMSAMFAGGTLALINTAHLDLVPEFFALSMGMGTAAIIADSCVNSRNAKNQKVSAEIQQELAALMKPVGRAPAAP